MKKETFPHRTPLKILRWIAIMVVFGTLFNFNPVILVGWAFVAGLCTLLIKSLDTQGLMMNELVDLVENLKEDIDGRPISGTEGED